MCDEGFLDERRDDGALPYAVCFEGQWAFKTTRTRSPSPTRRMRTSRLIVDLDFARFVLNSTSSKYYALRQQIFPVVVLDVDDGVERGRVYAHHRAPRPRRPPPSCIHLQAFASPGMFGVKRCLVAHLLQPDTPLWLVHIS